MKPAVVASSKHSRMFELGEVVGKGSAKVVEERRVAGLRPDMTDDDYQIHLDKTEEAQVAQQKEGDLMNTRSVED